MYRLLIIWSTGEKCIENFETYEEAIQAEKNMLMAFGHQIDFSCIDKCR